MLLKLSLYIDNINKIRCGNNRGKRINAKPILLFTVIACINNGTIMDNKILFDNHLDNSYKALWNIFHEDMSSTPLWKPFYFLSSEGFWYLKWKKGCVQKTANSAKFIRDNIEYAYFEDSLWELLQEENVRQEIMKVLEDLIRNK